MQAVPVSYVCTKTTNSARKTLTKLCAVADALLLHPHSENLQWTFGRKPVFAGAFCLFTTTIWCFSKRHSLCSLLSWETEVGWFGWTLSKYISTWSSFCLLNVAEGTQYKQGRRQEEEASCSQCAKILKKCTSMRFLSPGLCTVLIGYCTLYSVLSQIQTQFVTASNRFVKSLITFPSSFSKFGVFSFSWELSCFQDISIFIKVRRLSTRQM